MKEKLFIPAIVWFVVSFILLVIPGDDLPHNQFFNIPFFDKYIHLTMFFLLTYLFCFPLFGMTAGRPTIITWFKRIAVVVILYGIAMEFVQKYCVYARSFDLADIGFDSAGSLGGWIAARRMLIKKIGPDGNQGRNQN